MKLIRTNGAPIYDLNSFCSNSGTTTIHRPHGGGTLVIRPSHTHRPHQNQNTHYVQKRPSTTKYPSTTVNLPQLSENTVPDLDTASSYSTGEMISRILYTISKLKLCLFFLNAYETVLKTQKTPYVKRIIITIFFLQEYGT